MLFSGYELVLPSNHHHGVKGQWEVHIRVLQGWVGFTMQWNLFELANWQNARCSINFDDGDVETNQYGWNMFTNIHAFQIIETTNFFLNYIWMSSVSICSLQNYKDLVLGWFLHRLYTHQEYKLNKFDWMNCFDWH